MFSPFQRTKSAENVTTTRDMQGFGVEKRPSTVAELLMQIEGEGFPTKSKRKIEVKNYMRENVLRLREIQRVCRQTKEARNVPLKPEYKPNQVWGNDSSPTAYQNKTSRFPSAMSNAEIKMTRTNQNVDNRRLQSTPSVSKTTRKNGGLATGKQAPSFAGRQQSKGLVDKDNLPKEVKNEQQTRGRKHGPPSPPFIPHLSLHTPERSKLETSELLKEHEDCLETSNAKTAPSRPPLRRSSSLSCILPSNVKKTTDLKLPDKYQLGVVPKYLHVRQKQWRDDEEKKKKEAPDPSIPPGLELLPDAERLQTLSQLDQSYNELLRQMMMLPLRMDTLRIRQQKESIEKELFRIEEAIKIFSQPKVFIKNDK